MLYFVWAFSYAACGLLTATVGDVKYIMFGVLLVQELSACMVNVSGVPGVGVGGEPPSNFQRPSKIVPNSTRL